MERKEILHWINQERSAQDAEWGGTSNDVQHDVEDWANFIGKQLSFMVNRERSELECLIKVAALSVAAIEAITNESTNSA